jgi:hypothetical protein
MDILLLATTAVDLVALSALAWIVLRGDRRREQVAGMERASLERLHGNLGLLIADAERRARALEDALGDREESLRALLADLARAEGRRPLPSHEVRPAAGGGVTPLTRLDEVLDSEPRRRAMDPAEARLLRDLDVSLGRVRTA